MTAWTLTATARVGALALDVELTGDARPLALVGPNGSGKTTVLRIIAGAITPTAGRIQVGDAVLFDSDAHIDLPISHRRVGYVPQGYGLFAHLNVAANVAFGLTGARAARRETALAMLTELGCGHLADRGVGRLSGGEKQRVALARALVIRPRILLLDEPLAALDITTRRAVRAELAAHLTRSGSPAIIVTHDVRDVVALNARVAVLDAGRVVQLDDLDTVRRHPATAFAAEFVGAAEFVSGD
ncbi:MAG: molybdate transport system ATP-binding protein [Bradymonadia bacterium]|jgi:molybdate transport system ATP-binding protein